MNSILCQQVNKSYGNKQVLQAINLSVKPGEFFGLIGANGSGKSTLIKCMLDLTALDSGSIRLCGHNHTEVAARKDIAYLPDRFSPPAYLKGSDFLLYMLQLYGLAYSRADVLSVLSSLDLEADVLAITVNKLSKGMSQKLGLAVCLLSKKRLFILDEPMSGLDPKARILFKQQLEQLKQQGRSVFFSSHVLVDVDELADNMAVLHRGRILFTGSPADFKHNYRSEDLEQAYMNCIENE